MGTCYNCVKITSEEKVFIKLLYIFQEEYSFIDNNRKRESILKSIQKTSLIECNEVIEKKENYLDLTAYDNTKIKPEGIKNSQKNSLIDSINVLNKKVSNILIIMIYRIKNM